MNDSSDPGQCWSGQTADTLAALGINSHQGMRKQQKQPPKWVREGRHIISEHGPWVGDKH